MAIRVGTTAPGFELPDQTGSTFRLADQKGKRVLLSFYPEVGTKLSDRQIKDLEKKATQLTKLGCVAVGIGADTVRSNREWAKKLRVKKTRLLSDFWPHGRVAARFGLFDDPTGRPVRATVVIDADQSIVLVREYKPAEQPDLDRIVDYIRTLA